MIRLGWMTDKARVIGARDESANMARFKMLPKGLGPVMEGEIYQTEYFAVGASMIDILAKSGKTVFAMTTDPEFTHEAENVIPTTDYKTLVERFAGDTDEDLLIAGGKVIFELFLPHADVLHIAEADELVPGDVVFDAWDAELDKFALQSDTPWEGGHTLIYKRK